MQPSYSHENPCCSHLDIFNLPKLACTYPHLYSIKYHQVNEHFNYTLNVTPLFSPIEVLHFHIQSLKALAVAFAVSSTILIHYTPKVHILLSYSNIFFVHIEPQKAVGQCHTFDDVDIRHAHQKATPFSIDTFKPVASLWKSSYVRMCSVQDYILGGANGCNFKNIRSSHRSTYESVYARNTLTSFCNVP